MADFNLKLVVKDRPEKGQFNLIDGDKIDYKLYNGKLIYVNHQYKGKYIFSPYYVIGGTAHRLHYNSTKSVGDQFVYFTLDDLKSDDIIVFYDIG